MKEIGGYFEEEKTHTKREYYPDLLSLNLARNAVAYLIKLRKIKKLFVPYYLCDSIAEICNRENVCCEFYHIGKDLRPIFEKQLGEHDYLYLVNYFGQIKNEEILNYSRKFLRIIVDNVQSFFQPPLEGIDTIYSCRKYFGVPDGAYLSSDSSLVSKLKIDDSSNRLAHIFGRTRDGASAHFSDFHNVEKAFESLPLLRMSEITHLMLQNIDYSYVVKRRERNFAFLHNELKKYNLLSINIPVGPFAYPLYITNGDKVRKKMIDKKIYIPKLWPNVESIFEQDLVLNILPIPCDQRYNKNDMKRIIKELLLCMKN